MTLLGKVRDFLLKDVVGENETKKCAIMIRLSCLSLILYLVCLVITFCIFSKASFSLVAAVCIVLFVVDIVMTYKDRTADAYYFNIIIQILLVIGQVIHFGWGIGAQHFLFPLLVLTFLAIYTEWSHKIILAVFYCVLRLGLYFYTENVPPAIHLSGSETDILQILNTVCIMFELCALIACTGKESQEMERKLIQYNRKVEKLARQDALTGLANRRYALEELEGILDKKTGSHVFLNVAIGDIDLFKNINDTYGHDAGDVVLRTLADIMNSMVDGHGYVARFGGEEFLFIIRGMNGDEAYMLLERLRVRVQNATIRYRDKDIKVTMTFGLKEYDFSDSIEANTKRADEKLYEGKQSGRNKVVF